MKIFNKKILGLLIILAIVTVLFRLFLLDWLIESSLELSAGKMLKTKVTVTGLHLSISDGRLKFDRLTVADKANKNRSVFACGNTELKLNVKSLLRSQLHVQEIKVSEIEVGAEEMKIESKKGKKKADRKKKKSKLASYYEMDKISERLNIADITNFESLATFKRIEEASEKINLLSASLDAELSNSELDDSIDKLSADWNLLQKNQPKNITGYPAYFNQLSKVKQQSDIVAARINKRKELLQNTYKEGSEELEAVKKQSDADLDLINSKIDLISSKQDSFIEDIVGERYMGYINKVQLVFDIVKKLKKKKLQEAGWKEKLFYKGEDISFPIKNKMPRVLVEKVLFSGWWGKKNESNEFLGVIDELTSDQQVRNKTTKLRIKSKEYSSIKRTDIYGELDTRTDVDVISVNVDSIGNQLNPLYWDPQQIPFVIISGDYGISGNISMRGNLLTTIFQANTSKTAVEKNQSYRDSNLLHKMLASVVGNNDQYQFAVSMRGDAFAIDSNLDELLGKEYSNFIENKKKELRDQVKKEFDKQVKEQTSELTKQLDASKKQMQSALSKEDKKVKSKLDKINREIKKVEQNLKKESSKIQDAVKQGLQNLFK